MHSLLALLLTVVFAKAPIAADGVALWPRTSACELKAGEVLGRVKFDAAWTDYRGERVAAGTYELRYALQPPLKEHVTTYRDFAILYQGETMITPNGRHPAVLALFPVDAGAKLPRVRRTKDEVILETLAGGRRWGFVIAGLGERGL